MPNKYDKNNWRTCRQFKQRLEPLEPKVRHKSADVIWETMWEYEACSGQRWTGNCWKKHRLTQYKVKN